MRSDIRFEIFDHEKHADHKEFEKLKNLSEINGFVSFNKKNELIGYHLSHFDAKEMKFSVSENIGESIVNKILFAKLPEPVSRFRPYAPSGTNDCSYLFLPDMRRDCLFCENNSLLIFYYK